LAIWRAFVQQFSLGVELPHRQQRLARYGGLFRDQRVGACSRCRW
jgi:hypothetical protein